MKIFWKNEPNYFSVGDFKYKKNFDVPYLSVTYKNNSDSDYYFIKIIRSSNFFNYNDYPTIGIYDRFGNMNDSKNLFEQYIGCGNDKAFNVVISKKSTDFECLWEVFTENQDWKNNISIDVINNKIYEIYETLYYQDELNRIDNKYQLLCFKYRNKEKIYLRQAVNYIQLNKKMDLIRNVSAYEDINEKKIMHNYSPNFLFLKKGEEYSENFSLKGFYIVGGTYNFMIGDTLSYDYVNSDVFDLESTMNGKNKSIMLPAKVNGYNIYRGYFKSNAAKLDINNKEE